MKTRFKLLMSRISTAVSPRTSVIKLKINGKCVNKCSFCPFHDDPHLLEVRDLSYFFDMIERPRFKWVVINGGEPTIHPRFPAICAFLKERFSGRTFLTLGTNLIPLSKPFGRYPKMYRDVIETFDRIEVGCDDEHNNIHILESLAPVIVGAGIFLSVNVVEPFCSALTRNRVLALKDRLGIEVTFSEVHHFYQGRKPVNSLSVPCRFRTQNFLLNCNGDAFFCFFHEMERPLFNLFKVTPESLNYYISEYTPEPYNFCACCPVYRMESIPQRLISMLTRPLI